MVYYEFIIDKPLKYNLTGKFQAPSPQWQHFGRYMKDYELIVVTEGIAYLRIDDKEFSVKSGEFLIFSPTSRQAGYKESNCVFYWMHFTYDNPVTIINSDTLPQGQDKIYIAEYGRIENLEKLIVMMKHLQDNVRSYHNALHNNYMCTTILSELYSQFLAKASQETTDLKRKQLFNDIQDYIKWNRKDIKVDQIAKHFGYNKRYLSTLFHTMAGITLKQYITQQKLELAKYLLCDTNEAISEIAYQSGFQDHHNFMKVFKTVVGMTPTQFRNAYASRLLFYK